MSRALQAIRRVVTVEWPKATKENAKAHLLRVAWAGHTDIVYQARNRGDGPDWDAYANRPGNLNLNSVILPGPIVFRYRYYRQIIISALAMLETSSPAGSGRYRNSHTVFVNGVPSPSVPRDLKQGDAIFIANPLPYSRKLEIGKTKSGRDFLISVPNRIYERVAKNYLIPQYRKIAQITYGFVTPPNGYTLKADQAARTWLKNAGRWHHSPTQRADRRAGAAVLVPAIFIKAYN